MRWGPESANEPCGRGFKETPQEPSIFAPDEILANDNPAVWNHFEAEGRLCDDFENLDLHISCPIPDDAAVAAKSLRYIHDVSRQAIEEPPMTLASALDEFYVGEPIQWSVRATSANSKIRVALLAGNRMGSSSRVTSTARQ